MNSVEKMCEKYTVENALEHGKAAVGPVMGLVFKANPEMREDANSIKAIIEKTMFLIWLIT